MNQVSPQEEIAYIKNIINDSKRIIIDDGKGFILWGILVIIGLIATFLFKFYETYEYFWLVWPLLMGFGWIYTMIAEIKKSKRKRVSTFAGKILGALWFSTGIAMTIIILIGLYTNAFSSTYISPIVSLYNLLIFAGVMLFLQTIPGIILYQNSKKSL